MTDTIKIPFAFKSGCYLWTQLEIIAEQKTWDDNDESKDIDFTTNDLWVTSDNEMTPFPIDREEVLKQILGDNK